MELTKEYFDRKFEEQSEKFITKEYFDQHLDQKFEENLRPIREDIKGIKFELGEVKELVQKIDKRDQEDSNALSKSYVDHDNRLKVIESHLNIS